MDIIALVTQWEARLAAARGLAAQAPGLTRADWQQARRTAGAPLMVVADIDPFAQPWLGLHRLADGLIGLSYVVIAAALALFVWRVRRHLAVRRVVLLSFATFIGACGLTHFSHVLYSFDPRWLPLLLFADAATVVASVATAAFLPFELARVLALVMKPQDDGAAP